MGQWVVGYYGFTSIGRWLERIADRALAREDCRSGVGKRGVPIGLGQVAWPIRRWQERSADRACLVGLPIGTFG
jgi:hypothetical protein